MTHVWLRAYPSGHAHLVGITAPPGECFRSACGVRPLYWVSHYPSGIRRCADCSRIAS